MDASLFEQTCCETSSDIDSSGVAKPFRKKKQLFFWIPVFLRQTNFQSIIDALIVQKQRERSIRRLAIQAKEKERRKQPKATVQHPYRAFGAREKCQQCQAQSTALTAAATLHYQDPRNDVEPAELRKELVDRTGKGKDRHCYMFSHTRLTPCCDSVNGCTFYYRYSWIPL